MSLYEAFAKKFGKSEADAIVAAAEEHANAANSTNRCSDPFKWALLIVIGYDCVHNRDYAKHHGITVSADEFDEWVTRCADLGSHDGTFDYLAAIAGKYNKYVGEFA